MKRKLPDIKPRTPTTALDREKYSGTDYAFDLRDVSTATGMSPTFIRKVCGSKASYLPDDVVQLLDLDCYKETFIPRSKVIDYLVGKSRESNQEPPVPITADPVNLIEGNILDKVNSIAPSSVQCIVTSTPYWGLRIYDNPSFVSWADGDYCPFGHEQTPEAFVRHTTEVLLRLYDVLSENGSIWWNIMDSFNTRTQIRGNASEALSAMQGKDSKKWADHECRRHSAGHSYLKDGEQCLIPHLIAERASRIGFYVKSVITWAKTSALPEPQKSRVSRNLEYIIHLSKQRTPLFNKEIYRTLPTMAGGRNKAKEADKLSDVWVLPTSSGRDGHGAQFPIALPARCIALSSNEGDVVLDPFVGAGNSAIAARMLNRTFIGVDVSKQYLETTKSRLARINPVQLPEEISEKNPQLMIQESIL